jgi:signal transduction histidine kinase
MRALQYMTEDMEAAALRGDPIELQARLAQVRTQAQRMSSMLSGLLDYSTVGRKAMAIEDVDTGALARSVSGSIPHGTGMTIDVAGDWPVITTLKAPLDLVLRNLVDNAVKHHDKPTGKIRLECAPVGADVVISVIDNGPGIPPEHQASIFLPFRTLEAAGRPATGLGLGLALVQRTVESVGGRISLGGAGLDGRGTTFLVRWPAASGASILLS